MNQHMRALHPEVKPFACKHCDRLFTKKSNMVKHTKMVHEKIKPFACDECGRAFAESRDLKAHVDAVHRKLKPFACHLCDARCARKTQVWSLTQFYSVDFSKSRMNVKKCVFNKRTIKVCTICC